MFFEEACLKSSLTELKEARSVRVIIVGGRSLISPVAFLFRASSGVIQAALVSSLLSWAAT
jgi:hypothetical protein